jgi:hypothetical protein
MAMKNTVKAPKMPMKAKSKMMPKEEAEARKMAYKEKFGKDYAAPAAKPAPNSFKSQKEKDAYFKSKGK